MLKTIFYSLFFVSFVFLAGCSTTEDIDIHSAEKAFKEAKKYEDDERFEEAQRRYEEIKNKFPYSSWSKEADLRIAEIHFKKKDFSTAALAYSNFKYLYPNHPQIAYVSLQLALSYFNQLPPTIDRDLSKGHNAIQEFNLVLQKYPNTDFAKTAAEKKKITEDQLAEKELYIADFYYKRDHFLSAMRRYENLLTMPGPESIKRTAYYKGAICALEVGEVDKAKNLLEGLKQKYPGSKEAQETDELKRKYGI
jgi:outer membrane protein assembly factor BamD